MRNPSGRTVGERVHAGLQIAISSRGSRTSTMYQEGVYLVYVPQSGRTECVSCVVGIHGFVCV